MSTRQPARITAVVIVVLIAVITALGAVIVTVHLGAGFPAAVGTGGGAFVAIAGLGMLIVSYLLPPAPAAPLPRVQVTAPSS
ncbi:hypothetical protein [Streptomyces roseolus]|uniref:hypothetical protein n=1 Tax=Streptomyces roseolus TaxID=67358 RepID=UPI0036608B81